MALLDIFKKKKREKKEIKEEKKAKEEKEIVKEPKAVQKEKAEKASPVTRRRIRKKKKFPESYKILKTPHVTEKATDLIKENKYTFRVLSEANKVEIKRTIEDIYNVDVVSVKIINVHPKQRRLGRTLGQRKGYKKAIIRIREGQKIEVLSR